MSSNSGEQDHTPHTSTARSRSSLGFMALRANRPALGKANADPEDLFQMPRRMYLPDGNRFGLRRTTSTHSFDEYPEQRRYW